MGAHSLLVGGSIAARRLNCTASFQESLKTPIRDIPTEYAERGAALHAAMAELCVSRQRRRSKPSLLPQDLLGKNFEGRIISQVDIDEAITPAWNALWELAFAIDPYHEWIIVGVELRVQFPDIPAAFGTADVLLRTRKHILLADWKFGLGVFVQALYPDPVRGDAINEQLMFYLAAARADAPLWFKGRQMHVAVVQPGFDPGVSHTDVSNGEVEQFIDAMEFAVADALSAKPHYARGEWCRFAECKATCPLWTGPLLDLSAIDPNRTAMTISATGATAVWGDYLASAKRLTDSALQYKKLIDEMLLEHLKNGGTADGFALKPKVMDRKWIDDTATVEDALLALGFTGDEIWQPSKLQTFKVADAAAKRLKVEIPEDLRPRPRTNDVVLTSTDDPDKIEVRPLTEEFRAALKKLA